MMRFRMNNIKNSKQKMEDLYIAKRHAYCTLHYFDDVLLNEN